MIDPQASKEIVARRRRSSGRQSMGVRRGGGEMRLQEKELTLIYRKKAEPKKGIEKGTRVVGRGQQKCIPRFSRNKEKRLESVKAAQSVSGPEREGGNRETRLPKYKKKQEEKKRIKEERERE